ncbi:uncharacterized protein LACBIDRAFT_309871 [Laccaria bicolor S238N-H82]|uniref:Predicted protein n=1 Tax=Laccaria bicolor (strain S238N-H82 / ATCC MYA-4686) TaxID=486041 RepID=B0DT85_LACBS|nr:uncharacterized protein LACBIDRAFT_309871 [Laccaria bicolor S238N-H82]EDR02176.1 predicted protein [Laccaria bicolor S238N-H82]|eukprot:XP_001887121.1 predicted protein [Laccaria bicolor S238N-H82]
MLVGVCTIVARCRSRMFICRSFCVYLHYHHSYIVYMFVSHSFICLMREIV